MNSFISQAQAASLISKQFENLMLPSEALIRAMEHHAEMGARMAEMVQPMIDMQAQALAAVQPMIEIQRRAMMAVQPILDMYEQIASIVDMLELPTRVLGLEVPDQVDEESDTVEKLKKVKRLRAAIVAKDNGFEIYGTLVKVKMNTNHAVLLRALLHYAESELVTYGMIEDFFRQQGKPYRTGEKIAERILNARDSMYRFIKLLPEKLGNGEKMVQVVDGKGLKFNNATHY